MSAGSLPAESSSELSSASTNESLPLSRRRKLLFSGILLAVVLVLMEACAYAIIAMSGSLFGEPVRTRATLLEMQSRSIRTVLGSPNGMLQLDSTLGWRYRSGYQSATDRLTAQGVRGDREYSATPADSALRLSIFGDSFAYGNEVANPDAWTFKLEEGRRDLEVLNYGVGGYGMDQAYLRFMLEGRQLHPNIAVIAFTTDDIRRVVNVYRRFLSGDEIALFKPRFDLQPDGALVLHRTPAPTPAAYRHFADVPRDVRLVGANDQWYDRQVYENPLHDLSASFRLGNFLWRRVYRRYLDADRMWDKDTLNVRSKAFHIQTAIFQAFVKSADSMGVKPIVLFLPDRSSVERRLAGGTTMYGPLVRWAESQGVAHLDAIDAFRAAPDPQLLPQWFASGGHYSPRGNAIVADWLATQLPRRSNYRD